MPLANWQCASIAVIERLRFDKAKAKSKCMTSVTAARLRLFGQPLILEGEDRASYDELVARICDAIKPVDIIEEMLIADVVYLE
jgi:transcriptional regulator of aromatic amino acid metabolism